MEKIVYYENLKQYHSLEIERVNNLLKDINDTYTKAEIDEMLLNSGGEGGGTDTKNTAGATNSGSKLFLVGSPAQNLYAQTYTNQNAYIDNGNLYSNNKKVLIDDKSLDATTGHYSIIDGLMVKWGHYTGTINTQHQFTVTFNEPFPNGCLYADIMNGEANTTNTKGLVSVVRKSATSVTFGTPQAAYQPYWIAFGY